MPTAHRRSRALALPTGLVLVTALALGSGPALAAETPSPSPVATAEPSDAAEPSADPTADPAPTATIPDADTPDVDTPGAEIPTPDPSATATTTDLPDDGGVVTNGPPLAVDPETGLAVGIARYIPYPASATAVGDRGLATATLAIPGGMTPVILRGRLTSLADNPGLVRIRAGNSYVEMDAVTGGEFELTLEPDAVVNGNLTVEVRNDLDVGTGRCVSDTTTTETVDDLVIGFIGVETPPDTVAGFFSPPVQKVTLVVPDDASPAVAEAALAGAGALATRYDALIPVVVQTTAEFDADPTRFDDSDGPIRIVRLSPSNEPVNTVQITDPGVPMMTISGPAAELAKAAAALAAPELGLAGAPEVTELSDTRKSYTTSSLTLAELGAAKPTLVGLGRLEYVVAIGQDAFGGPTSGFAIHLEGAHTPPQDGGLLTASVLWNGQLVEAQALSAETSTYVADATIPAQLVERTNSLTIRLDASPPGGNCESGAALPAQLDILGVTSTVTATPGQSLPEGFVRYPQAFGNTLHVAFGSGEITPALIRTGCALVVSLQRATAQRMNIELLAFDAFVAATTAGVVIGASPDDADTLKAPLRFEPWRQISDAETDFTVTVDGPFAALESFEYLGRNIVMLGSTAPTSQAQPQLDQLADEAQNGLFGWFALGGNILVAQPGYDTITTLDLRTLVPQESVLEERSEMPVWLFVLAGGLLALIIGRILVARARRRRLRRVVAESTRAEAGALAGSGVANGNGGADEPPAPRTQEPPPDRA